MPVQAATAFVSTERWLDRRSASTYHDKTAATRRSSPVKATLFDLGFVASDTSIASAPDSSWIESCSSNLWLSTIDSDIAAIPENEFAPIFAGGILVMFGGLLSALIVGFILEQNDSYASIIADSYAQAGSEDSEFWKGLSDEEKKKTQELLARMKQQDGSNASEDVVVSTTVTNPSPEDVKPESPEMVTTEIKKEDSSTKAGASTQASDKEVDMFSDYSN